MICRTHLDREVHTAADLLDLIQLGISSYPSTPHMQGKGKDCSRAPNTSTKITFTRVLAT